MSGHIENITAGESITAPAWVYISSADGKAYKASASSTSNPAVGLVFANASADGPAQILFSGVYEWPSSTFTPGAAYYLSASTGGAMTTTAPSNAQRVGVAVSSTRINISPEAFSGPASTYKVYAANITQSGTSSPSAVVLENTLGITPTWARSSQGVYTLTASNTWTSDKTALPGARMFVGGEDDDMLTFSMWSRTSQHVLTMECFDRSTWAYSELNVAEQGFFIEIRVYL